MHRNFLHKICIISLCTVICVANLFTNEKIVYAERDYNEEAEARKSQPIQSNQIENWPQGPELGAESAILMEANTGTILYAKNIDEKLYPASTTKILTSLVAIENSEMNETVYFSHEAVFSIEKGSSNMGMDAGQSISMEQCLYGILVHSANETCNAVGEHIAGDIDGYVDMMNQKAAELGCTNSHFVTTNGLHDENHYTTARDLATIARAFFSNETLSKISGTAHYYIPPTATQPDDIDLWTHNSLTKGTYTYDGYIGGKTGFTSDSRQTLVSCAERDGIKLICVIMKEESPNQFLDTIALFDYGFNNFQKINIAETETNYTINDSELFNIDSDVFFNNDPIIEISPTDYVIIPKTISFEDLTSNLSYETANMETSDSLLATIHYEYQGVEVGNAAIILTPIQETSENQFLSDSETISLNGFPSANDPLSGSKIIFINILKVIAIILIALIAIMVIIFTVAFCKNYNFARRRKRRLSRKRRRKNRYGNSRLDF